MMRGAWAQFGKGLLDFLLPPICPVTHERVESPGLLSATAWAELRFIEAPFCPCCGAPQDFAMGAEMLCAVCLSDPPPFDTVRSAWVYNDVSRYLILRFKHGDALALVRSFEPVLSRLVTLLPARPSLVVPVPLHRFRLLRRLYNQAALLAQSIAQKDQSLTYAPDVLERIKATKSQGHMNARDRQKNVRAAFRVHRRWADQLKGRHILLVDDVYTTGATLRECARTLKKAGAARVDCVTIARVQRA